MFCLLGYCGSKLFWVNDVVGGSDVSGLGIKIDIMGEKGDEDLGNVKLRIKEVLIWII